MATLNENHLFDNFTDPRWRLNHLYSIVDKHGQLVPFQVNSIQRARKDVTAPRKMILKARQFGVTTGCVIDLLDHTMFNRNVTNAIIAHEQDAITKIFRIVRRAYKYMPESLKPRIDKGGGSKYCLAFPDMNSMIYCDLESRGDTINRLHISEAAFMQYDRYLSTLQAVPKDGQVTVETTANGMENFFYEEWIDDESIYEKLFFPWFFHHEYRIGKGPGEAVILSQEERDFKKKTAKLYPALKIDDEQIKYRRFKQKELKASFIQEYPEDDATCFINSGRTVVDQVLFKRLISEAKPVLREEDGVQFFAERESKKDYIVYADPAQGVGRDWSVGGVLCVQDMEEVAFFRGQLNPFLFAKKLKQICDFFTSGARMPLLGVECNNHGHAVLLELENNIGYRNLFYAKDGQPGWLTNSITRPIMIDQLIETVSAESVRFHSIPTLREMSILVEEKGKIQAPKGRHDDCVMAAGIGVQLLLQNVSIARLYHNIENDIMV